jgi:hypothetical protein
LLILQFDIEAAALAWAIGGAVGASFRFLGGRGVGGAVLCGTLTVAAIVGGKLVAVDSLLDEAEESFQAAFVESGVLDDLRTKARAYREVESDEELRAFMAEHEFATDADQLDAETLALFRETQGPFLATFLAEGPLQAPSPFGLTRTEILLESLSGFDLLFFSLAVFTAVQLALGRGARRAQTVRVAVPERTPEKKTPELASEREHR